MNVTRENEENISLMSKAEYNNLIENQYIRSNSVNYKRLIASIEQLKSGTGVRHDIQQE